MNAPASAELGAAPPRSSAASAPPLVVLVGNPNVGKTTLFNRLTGENARVGNYPGVTVERRSGKLALEQREGRARYAELVDVPGAYSLSARSAEEQIALSSVLGLSGHPTPELCVVVVDAGQLGRNLYFALQLAELSVPLIVAPQHDRRGLRQPAGSGGGRPLARSALRRDRRPARQGARRARDGRSIGRSRSRRAAPSASGTHASSSPLADQHGRRRFRGSFGAASSATARSRSGPSRASKRTTSSRRSPTSSGKRCLEIQAKADGRDLDREIIGARYAFIDRALPRLFERADPHPPKRKPSERATASSCTRSPACSRF